MIFNLALDNSTRESIIHDLKQSMDLEADLYDHRFFFSDGSNILRVFSPQHFYTISPGNDQSRRLRKSSPLGTKRHAQ